MSQLELIPLIAVGLATLAASVTDLWKFKVYNVLTFPTLLLGLIVSGCLGGWAGLGASLLGAGLGLGLLVVFFALGGVGAGDVKLLTAVGAWLGPQLTYHVFISTALIGGLYAVAAILARSGVGGLMVELASSKQLLMNPALWKRPASNIEGEVLRPDRRKRLVPYAAMTCLGFFATLIWWGPELGRAWPPAERSVAVSTVSISNIHAGGAR